MFLRIWLLGWRSFSVSLPFCLLIGRTFADWACFCVLGCSVSAPLAFPHLFTCLLTEHLLVVHVLHFWFLGRHSFMVPHVFAFFLAAHLLVVHVLHFWLLSRCSFSISLPFCLLIGRTFADWACLCILGCSVSAPLAFPRLFTCLLTEHLLVVHVSHFRFLGRRSFMVPHVFAFFLAAHLLVVHVCALLVAQQVFL